MIEYEYQSFIQLYWGQKKSSHYLKFIKMENYIKTWVGKYLEKPAISKSRKKSLQVYLKWTKMEKKNNP